MAVQIFQDPVWECCKSGTSVYEQRDGKTKQVLFFGRQSFGVLKLCEKQKRKKKNHLRAKQFGV